jgi:anti-anti-sigma regulatory factor
MREYSTLRSESDGATITKAFEVTVSSTAATHAVVQPCGDMDMSNVHLLTSVLAGQLRLGRRFVRLDLSRTTVSDSSCLHHLVPTHEHFVAARGLLALTNVSAKLAPLLHSTQLDGTLFITDGPGPGPG